MKKVVSRLALCVVILCGTACYSYAPVQSPSPGMEIRARLTAEAAVRRSQGLDEPIVRLDGTIVDATPAGISLDVLVARASSAFQDIVIRDTVQLETVEIQSLLARRFSPLKTVLATVGAGVAVFAVVKGIDQVVGGNDEIEDPGNPNLRSPIFSWVGFRYLRLGSAR